MSSKRARRLLDRARPSHQRLGRIALAPLLTLSLACGPAASPAASPESRTVGPARAFSYVAVDGTPVDSATTRGRATVILFLATYDVVSQLAARQLNEIYHSHRPRINALAVALEPPKNAPLVAAFSDGLGLSFPIALADPGSRFGGGREIIGVPTTIVLDRDGREVFRVDGFVPVDTLEAEITRASGPR